MKRTIYLFIGLFVFFETQYCAAQCGWKALQLDDTVQVSFGRATYISIAQQGVPGGIPYHYIAYSDGMVGGKASVVYPVYSGLSFTKWANLGKQGFSAGQANYTSIAMADSIPYIAYQDMANGGKVTVMQYKGGIWSPLGTAGFSAGSATYISIAATNQSGHDSVYVAYSDGTNSNKLIVMGFNGTKWRQLGASISSGASTYNSLQIDPSNGMLYVAFSDGGMTNTVRVFEFTSGAWNEIVGTSIITPTRLHAGSYVSLNIINSVAYVAYSDATQGNRGVVMTFGSLLGLVGTLNTVGINPFSSHPVSYVSMTSLSNGNIFVAYNDNTTGFANVMECNSGGAWTQWGSPNFSAGQTAYDGIATLANTPFVAYQDSAVAGKATVMAGGQNNTPPQPWTYLAPPTGIDNDTSYAYTPSVAINPSTRMPFDAFIDNRDSNKTCVMNYNGGTWSYLGSRVSPGPSAARILYSKATPLLWPILMAQAEPLTLKNLMALNGWAWAVRASNHPSCTFHIAGI